MVLSTNTILKISPTVNSLASVDARQITDIHTIQELSELFRKYSLPLASYVSVLYDQMDNSLAHHATHNRGEQRVFVPVTDGETPKDIWLAHKIK